MSRQAGSRLSCQTLDIAIKYLGTRMSSHLILSAVLLLFASNVLAANKCVGPDSKVTFQDAPCPNTAKSQERLKLRLHGNTTSSADSYGVPSLDLSGSPDLLSLRALAALDSLASASTDCRIKLDVYGPTGDALRVCNSFITHHKAWWTPATNAVRELLDDREWSSRNMRTIEKSTSAMEKTTANAEYILRRIQTQSR